MGTKMPKIVGSKEGSSIRGCLCLKAHNDGEALINGHRDGDVRVDSKLQGDVDHPLANQVVLMECKRLQHRI